MEAVELFMIEMDTEETKNRTLNTFNSLRSPLHHETPLSRVRTADTEVTNNNLHT